MEITQLGNEDIVIFELKGRFDAGTSEEFERKVINIIGSEIKKTAIDFSNIEYISSAGLRMVLTAAKKLKKAGGKLVLFAMKDHIKEVFEMTGFSTIISIAGTKREAVDSF